MEFGKKLYELRKSSKLTQDELAENLYVSRTAISKWESGRGYPSIDSLKEISKFFSVSIDDLLSGEKIISIAEKENKTNIKNICGLLLGIFDMLYFVLIVLPLYSVPAGEHIYYAVNLLGRQKTPYGTIIFWVLVSALILCGAAETVLSLLKIPKWQRFFNVSSMILGIFCVLMFAVTREVYAISAAFLLLVIKGILILKYVKSESTN